MKMEYAIVGKTTNPNELGVMELDFVSSDLDEMKFCLDTFEKENPTFKGKFKIVCRQVTDWCETLRKG